ncbi:MAG: YwaF family protein [Clostridia bacterium]|nr:YwaF family protein [Clostridia bacterium]
MAYFWETSGSIPKGHGFSLFDGTHLFWLFLCLAAAVIVPYTYRRCSASGRRRYRRVMALLILADELGKWIMLLSTGLFTKNYLPFQLCTINIFIILIHMVLPKKSLRIFSTPSVYPALCSPSFVRPGRSCPYSISCTSTPRRSTFCSFCIP